VGAVLTWAEDQAQSGTRSLKIVKPATGGVARWISGNNVRYWVDNIPLGVDIKVGAWVKTSGVNTIPANDSQRWQLKFWFYDASDVLIGGQPFVLNVDQTVASKDWYADTNGVGTLNLPTAAAKLLISAEAGANATGTVWFDTFIFVGRASAWAGQNWNGFADADSGWQYWIGPNGGNDGLTVFPGSGVTTQDKHSGNYSLKLMAPPGPGRGSNEAVFFTETVPIPAGSAGKRYLLSTWVRTSQVVKDSVFNAECALGFTWTWHSKMFTDGGGWNEVAGADYRFALTDTASGWTQYQAIMTVPDDPSIRAVSVRARSWHLWTGISYWDDFEMNPVSTTIVSVGDDGPGLQSAGIPTEYRLLHNFPNPFNPSTTIAYELPKASVVRIQIYNLLGQMVRTLVDQVQSAGKWTVVWKGEDDAGATVASGIYFYRLVTPDVMMTQKMLLMK
jgi:hypothetical protein